MTVTDAHAETQMASTHDFITNTILAGKGLQNMLLALKQSLQKRLRQNHSW